MNLDGKRIVITGASSGLGKALLQELSTRKVQIVAVGRDETRLQDAIRSVGTAEARVVSFNCDLALRTGVDDLFDFAIEQMGAIDVFIANAGFAYWERIQEPDWNRIQTIFQTNVFSPIYTAQKIHTRFQGTDYRLVITSSVLGRVGLDGYALYSSTKAALDRFVEVFRLEIGQRGRLVLVYPLAVQSGFYRTAGQAPTPWLRQPVEVAARAIVRGLEKDRKTIYTSWLLRPMLLLDRFLPFLRRWYQALDATMGRRHQAAQERSTDQGQSGIAS